jgi:hypothetical protein
MAATVPDDGRVPAEDGPQTEKTSVASSKESGEETKGGQDIPDAGKESGEEYEDDEELSGPALADEEVPPLPNEPLPGQVKDDGWDPIWDDNTQAFYFYNRFTGISQWENPRVPDAEPGGGLDGQTGQPRSRVAGGYDPAIHGDYDPTAPYAQQSQDQPTSAGDFLQPSADPNLFYTATGTFNRFTGKWQPSGLSPENFNDENKSRRQMNAYFDVDAAANSHDGKSLKAERSGKKLTKKELKAFKEKRRERKEEKRRAWLRD